MSSLDKELFDAVSENKLAEVRILLGRDASVNYHRNFRGYTPLHEAAKLGNVEIADLMIRNSLDVNAPDNYGATPLHVAAEKGNVEVADMLIRNSADVNASDNNGTTPLHKAAKRGNVEVTNILIRNNATVNVTDHDGLTPLHDAAMGGNIKVTELLIGNNAELNASDNVGATPLHTAAMHGNVEVTIILIRNNATVNVTDNNGTTPLHDAAKERNEKITELLIGNNAEVNATDNKGTTPLHDAAMGGNKKVTEFLIGNNADVNATDDRGATPLHTAAIHGNVKVADILIRNKATVNVTDSDGRTPLHCAAIEGTTPFSCAARDRNKKVTELLIRNNADVNATDNVGKTPIDIAEDSENNIHSYRMIRNVIKGNSDILIKTRKQSSAITKDQAPTKEKLALPTTMQSEEKDIQLPWLVDAEEFQRMLSQGTFLSYENRLSLGGPCRAGKSTLASVLIGEKIPLQWNSTDGLVIYFGRNGIDIYQKKMVPLKKGDRGHDVLAKILRGKPDVFNKSKPRELDQRETLVSRNTSKNQNENNTSKSLNTDMPIQNSVTRTITNELSNQTHTSVAKSDLQAEGTEAPGQKISKVRNDILTLECQRLKLQSDILDEVRTGQYKIEIAPSDLIDFGGQKSYDMTHQLFIQHKGSFLLMFDGRFGLHNQLEDYPAGVTAASILKHWVDSILTYTADTDEIMPMILFAATHRDMCEGDTAKMKECFLADIKEMFSSHEKKKHIHLDTLYFINGVDKNDVDIQRMTDKIVIFAMRQTSWGQRRPMQWVPLELQISTMKMKNVNILTKENLQQVNELNADLALTESQMDDFLLVQHSLGKLMYYNLPGLDKFIIIHPPALVNILRSFVTDEQFWPAEMDLRYILETMTKTGRIYKRDLLKIWKQPQFNQYMQDDAIKEFVLKLLVNLDILIVPKAFKQSSADVYLVPCMIKAIRPDFNRLGSLNDKTICLQYTLAHSSIPSALAFKVIGAAVIAWPLKEEDNKPCLYHKAAVLNVSEDEELQIWVENNRVNVYLTNKKSLLSISPDVAASIQECLTKNIESSLLFYHRSSGNKIKLTNVFELYTLAVGVPCGNDVCLIPVQEVNDNYFWKCDKGMIHDTRYLRYWIFNKKQQMCPTGCKGLRSNELGTKPSDKHLVRLASRIGIHSFREIFIHLGMTTVNWENIVDMYGGQNREGIIAMALVKWKESKISNLEEPTLNDLSYALTEANFDKHTICQIFREETKLLDIADFKLQETPRDDVLKELSHRIGNCAMQLGIELGISFNEIERSFVKYPKDLFGLVEDILNTWKATSKVKTIHSLMMALRRVNGGGVDYLYEMTK